MCGKVASRILTAVLLLSTVSGSGSLAAECLRYGAVTLTGRLVQQTYPGPPDYESVTRADEPLIIWVLQLDRGICVDGSNSSDPSAYNRENYSSCWAPVSTRGAGSTDRTESSSA